jgi:hypothetical protein
MGPAREPAPFGLTAFAGTAHRRRWRWRRWRRRADRAGRNRRAIRTSHRRWRRRGWRRRWWRARNVDAHSRPIRARLRLGRCGAGRQRDSRDDDQCKILHSPLLCGARTAIASDSRQGNSRRRTIRPDHLNSGSIPMLAKCSMRRGATIRESTPSVSSTKHSAASAIVTWPSSADFRSRSIAAKLSSLT